MGRRRRIEEERGRVRGVKAELVGDNLAFQARRFSVNEEGGQALVTASGIRLREDQDQVRDRAVGYPELAAVKDPVVSVALRCQLHRRWV